MKYLILMAGPLGFAFFLNAAIDATRVVNLDFWSAYIFLGLCLPFAWLSLNVGLQICREIDWPVLYRHGFNAAVDDSRLQRYFAERLYHFDNALDALQALEILRQHGVEPGPHQNL